MVSAKMANAQASPRKMPKLDATAPDTNGDSQDILEQIDLIQTQLDSLNDQASDEILKVRIVNIAVVNAVYCCYRHHRLTSYTHTPLTHVIKSVPQNMDQLPRPFVCDEINKVKCYFTNNMGEFHLLHD